MANAKIGDTVQIHFTGKLEHETVIDSSVDSDPLQFTIGEGIVIPGLEQGVLGMKVGDKKTITVPPEDAFGQEREELVVELKKSEFPEGIKFAIGLQLQIKGSDGQLFKVKIVDLTEDTVTVDGNHPLAGNTLVFDVEMVEVA